MNHDWDTFEFQLRLSDSDEVVCAIVLNQEEATECHEEIKECLQKNFIPHQEKIEREGKRDFYCYYL